jgi:hypothetical protein
MSYRLQQCSTSKWCDESSIQYVAKYRYASAVSGSTYIRNKMRYIFNYNWDYLNDEIIHRKWISSWNHSSFNVLLITWCSFCSSSHLTAINKISNVAISNLNIFEYRYNLASSRDANPSLKWIHIFVTFMQKFINIY